MPALLRYFSDLIHFKTSKLNPIPLHGNPILDNFVFKHAAVQTGRTFASAHSRGLRLEKIAQVLADGALPQRIRAGCDRDQQAAPFCEGALPQRIRAGCDCIGRTAGAGAHPLPQRIRAGCDTFPRVSLPNCFVFATAHSCGLRHGRRHGQGRIPPLCHSAFVRVATTI